MSPAPVDGAPGVAGHTLVFVAGLHRSGTTPLTRLLGAHPQISTFRDTGVKEDEGQHLQDVYPSARAYGGAGRFAFAPQAHLTESSELVTATNAQRLFDSWSAHWDLSRPYLVEKSPPNLIMTRFLQALFPQSRHVVIVRHPVVVALSTRRWAGPAVPLSRLIEHWLTAHETFCADAPHVARLHVLKYEHLVSETARTLGDLAHFLGLRGPIRAGGLEPSRSSGYREQWQAMHASRRPWHALSLKRLHDRYGERASRFGYDLRDLDTVAPFPKLGPRRTGHA